MFLQEHCALLRGLLQSLRRNVTVKMDETMGERSGACVCVADVPMGTLRLMAPTGTCLDKRSRNITLGSSVGMVLGDRFTADHRNVPMGTFWLTANRDEGGCDPPDLRFCEVFL